METSRANGSTWPPVMGVISTLLLLGFGALFAATFLFGVINRGGLFSARMMAVVFWVMPTLSVATVVSAVLLKPEGRTKMALILVSSVVALYLAEGLVPFIGHVAAAMGDDTSQPPFDERDKLRVVLDLRREGVDAVPSIEPKGLLRREPDGARRSSLSDGGRELLPLAGVANRETVLCNEAGKWITHRSDRYGMNNPVNLWSEKIIDVAAVGDSFTNGWCSEPKDHFVSLLRRNRPRTVNLGMSGNGPLLILASVREYLPEHRPKMVLWFHYEGNDYWDLLTERASPLLMRYLETDETQTLRERQPAIDREIEAYVQLAIGRRPQQQRRTSRSWASVATMHSLRTVLGLKYHPRPDYEMLGRVLLKTKTTVEAWGAHFTWCICPRRRGTTVGRWARVLTSACVCACKRSPKALGLILSM